MHVLITLPPRPSGTKELQRLGWTLPKIPIISKNALNKSCSDLKFLQKTQRMHMPIFPKSGAKGLQKLPFSKYYKVLKWESRFTLGLNAAENADHIKKRFK